MPSSMSYSMDKITEINEGMPSATFFRHFYSHAEAAIIIYICIWHENIIA